MGILRFPSENIFEGVENLNLVSDTTVIFLLSIDFGP